MENMMNKLQNLVAYPKINEDFYSRTLSGGVITLASSIVMLLLFSEDELLQMVQSKNLTLSFSSESSIEEELKSESTADAITILVHEGAFGSIGDDQSLLKYLKSLGQHQ